MSPVLFVIRELINTNVSIVSQKSTDYDDTTNTRILFRHDGGFIVSNQKRKAERNLFGRVVTTSSLTPPGCLCDTTQRNDKQNLYSQLTHNFLIFELTHHR